MALFSPICKLPGSLQNKLAVITGCNTGIGLETAAEMARRGATIVMACRDPDRANKARQEILDRFGENSNEGWRKTEAGAQVEPFLQAVKPEQLIFEQLDLSSLASVRDCAQRILSAHPKIDFLINNAGLICSKYNTTVDGFEMTVGVNHLGHFLFTDLLLPALKAAAPSRIIIVSSEGHVLGDVNLENFNLTKNQFKSMRAYSRSKLANIMHAKELARQLEGTGVTVVSLHPGVVKTEIQRGLSTQFRRFLNILLKPVMVNQWLGTQTTLHTVLATDIQSGGYYSACKLAKTSRKALDAEMAKSLWMVSRQLVGLETS